jgi:hypothetical protein
MSDKTFNLLMLATCFVAFLVVGLDLWYWRP